MGRKRVVLSALVLPVWMPSKVNQAHLALLVGLPVTNARGRMVAAPPTKVSAVVENVSVKQI